MSSVSYLKDIDGDLQNLANPDKAKVVSSFFKTGKGEYGEGDKFIGVTVPDTRKIAMKYFDKIYLNQVQSLLNSEIHEYRSLALMILVAQFEKFPDRQKDIYEFYLKNTSRINNWDLVDLSAYKIVGTYLSSKSRDILYKLVVSDNLWERRIAIVSTFYFIREKDFADTIKISEILLNDKHDLIQKAVGWMLREVGKKDEKVLLQFLDKYSKTMSRTMLRYAVERLDSSRKKIYMTR